MFGFVCLYLFPSIAELNFADDSWVKHQSMRIAEYH